MNREQKKEHLAMLKTMFDEASLVLVVRQSGMTVPELSELRHKVRGMDGQFKVTKNTLARRAVRETDYAYLEEFFEGQSAIATAQDPVAVTKVIFESAKDSDKMTLVGGGLGTQNLTLDDISTLAKLPSLDSLRAQLIGLLTTPASKMASLLQAPGRQIAQVLSAHANNSSSS